MSTTSFLSIGRIMSIYVTLPEYFKAVKGHPGYFFNESDQCVYSLKIGGTLKKLKEYTVSDYVAYKLKYNVREGEKYYMFSKNGVGRIMMFSRIKKLVIDEVVKIPMEVL